MKKQTIDQNGKPVTQSIRKERNGWSVAVWFGSSPATNVRRYTYETRSQAQAADISDQIGKRGRIS